MRDGGQAAALLRRLALGLRLAPLLQQRVPLRPHGRQVALLDVAVALDLLGQPAISTASAWLPACRPASSSSTSARYSPISARSVRRSSVRPNTSSGVPRRPFSLASTWNRWKVAGPNLRLTSSPLSLRLAISGGARW
jgi:hypothetical protein